MIVMDFIELVSDETNVCLVCDDEQVACYNGKDAIEARFNYKEVLRIVPYWNSRCIDLVIA